MPTIFQFLQLVLKLSIFSMAIIDFYLEMRKFSSNSNSLEQARLGKNPSSVLIEIKMHYYFTNRFTYYSFIIC